MEINKELLQKALDNAKSGVASKEIIAQTTAFCFLNKQIVTYNDEVSVSYPIPLELTAAVNANELYAFVSKCKTETIDITETETELIFKSGRSKAGLLKQSEIVLPLQELQGKKQWKILPVKFLYGLSFCMTSAGHDMTKPVLTGVHVKDTILQSSDGYRIAYYGMDEPVDADIVIPATSCPAILKFQPRKIAITEGWAHFQNEDKAVLSCRILAEKFPDTSKFLEMEGVEIKLPKMDEILEKAGIFSKRTFAVDECVTITLKDKKLLIRSESETGWFEESAKIEYKGEPLSIMVSPYLIKDILKEEVITLYNDNRLLFTGDNWQYLTMLKMQR